jgi:hypothetical protein
MLQTQLVGFEDLMAVNVNIAVFLGVTPCSRVDISPSFTGICLIHLQGIKNYYI